MKNIFVHTTNAKHFITAMKEAEKSQREPALLTFHGEAGRGKTSCARYFAAQEGWAYIRALRGWSPLWMLQDFCYELRIDPIPKRAKPAFEAIRERLLLEPKPVLVDEADKLDEKLLEWIRDLADITLAPFALIGEKLVVRKMQREKRIWSRTLRAVEFAPITTKDILFFGQTGCGHVSHSRPGGAYPAENLRGLPPCEPGGGKAGIFGRCEPCGTDHGRYDQAEYQAGALGA